MSVSSETGATQMFKNRRKVCLLTLTILGIAVGFQLLVSESLPQINSVVKRCSVLATPRSVFAAPTVPWSADMETGGDGLSQWYLPSCCADGSNGGGVINSGIAAAGPSFDFAHGGTYSARLDIKTPSTPTSGARLFRWNEPQSNSQLYYSVWYYFPQRFTPNGTPAWWNVFQWKSKSLTFGNNPFFILNVGNRVGGAMYFYLYDQYHQISYDQTVKDIPEGQWTRVEAFYACAPDISGHVTFWQDGVQIFDVANVQTRYLDGDCQWSVNNYTNSVNPTPATIYVDDAAICSGGRCP